MSILKKKAEEKMYTKKYTEVITTRIQKDLYDSFKNHCDEHGFKMSEAIKILIENELKSIQNVYKDVYEYEEPLVSTFELPAHRVISPEVQMNTISKEDLDPDDPLEAMILAQYEKFGD